MKIITMAGLVMLLSINSGFAEGTATAPLEPEGESLDESKCLAVWSDATAGEDRLSYDKAAPYVSDMRAADPDNDGYFDKTEFIDACQKGLVQSASNETTAPKSGHHIMLPRKPTARARPKPGQWPLEWHPW
jgi:hypothetical protein